MNLPTPIALIEALERLAPPMECPVCHDLGFSVNWTRRPTLEFNCGTKLIAVPFEGRLSWLVESGCKVGVRRAMEPADDS